MDQQAAVRTKALLDALRDPATYGSDADEVDVVETHASWIFFVGERVYKVKKPVRFAFLDFTTLTQRRYFCDAEVELNQELAPGVYTGVVPVVRTPEGTIRVGAMGTVVEWAVAMKRLPARDMLDARLERGEVDNADMRDLAAVLARFHHASDRGAEVEQFGSPAAVRHMIEQNLSELREFVGSDDDHAPSGLAALSPRRHAFLTTRAHRFLQMQRSLLERRVAEGHVCNGHGDLHAGNICCTADGPIIYDRIEFNRALRCGDVACDLAFLAMDLDDRGFPAFAKYLVHRYGERAGDREIGRVLPFYKTYRALVRAKVAGLTATAPDASAERRAEHVDRARRYFSLATAYELPPALILMCGLPGSGKSWLARRIAAPLRALVHRSDVRRRSLAGLASGPRGSTGYRQGAYTPDMSERTYRDLLDVSLRNLRAGHSAIVDATFTGRLERRVFIDAASRLDLPWFLIHVDAPEDIVKQRIERRAREEDDPSEATLEVYRRARAGFDEPDELPPSRVLRVDSAAATPSQVVDELLERMLDAC